MKYICPTSNQTKHKQASGMKSFITFFSTFTTDKKILLTITPIIAVLIDSKQALVALSILILIDLITGALKSLHIKEVKINPLKLQFWKTITSKGLRESWRKAYEYGIGIIVLVIVESLLTPGMLITFYNKSFSIVQIGIACTCVIEAYSIFENIEAVTKSNPLKKLRSLIPSFKDVFK